MIEPYRRLATQTARARIMLAVRRSRGLVAQGMAEVRSFGRFLPANREISMAEATTSIANRNIELKARVRDDFAAANSAVQYLQAQLLGEVWQRDVYFFCADPKNKREPGRLKLRGESVDGQEWHWSFIWYERQNARKSRPSDYLIAPVHVDDAVPLVAALDQAWGKFAEVDKHRKIYLHGNIRIHLDTVVNLGRFVEFEAVLTPDEPPTFAHDNLKRLANLFQIEDSDLIESSYGDMMRDEYLRFR